MSSDVAVEISCPDVAAEVDHFVALGWRIVDVSPADDPRRVTIDGHGLRLVVVRGIARNVRLLVPIGSPLVSTSPNGTSIVSESFDFWTPALVSTAVVTRASDANAWHLGRAGMSYRDLVPDRQGGAVIASHIRIPTGGPVPDYPHYHEVRFQLIFCQKGWVRLAYEAQGEPFVLRAGECVIQPPMIRHRVLESSDELHVVEIGYPAEHLTIADHDHDFTTDALDPDRTWDGQRFVRFRLEDRQWTASRDGGVEADTGVASATKDLADVRLVHVTDSESWSVGPITKARFVMFFVLDGRVHASIDGREEPLSESDAAVVPVGSSARITGVSEATILLVSIDTDSGQPTDH